MMRVKIMAGLAATAGLTAPAIATPASGFSTEQLAKGVYAEMNLSADKDGKWDLKLKTKAVSDVYTVRNTITPGGQSGWHTHPGPSLITVTAGTVTVYDADGLCQPETYSAGAGFTDPGSGHNVTNQGSINAVTVVTQIIPRDAPRRIDMDAPNNCSF